ncbi:Uma2 family endonuclease [Actinacidiphila acidipaludis]|uniref:Uma2 family endonuclease n=1 Tax=Actinacidiphila acidipaludis TaxID=2873382 RepID=A0ABS7QAL2_9ACTN|nr:Uma2 family endonuclease [Streptomyces acidipaludis]MBY8879769.1 Uma2 family endonuclease [Streptomyces acidipaludis]
MDYARMRAVAEELSKHTPDYFRGYEIRIDGIIMMVPPSRPHERTALRIRQQLDHQLPAQLVAHTGGEVEDASIGRLRRPDVIVVPDAAFEEDTMEPFHPEDVVLVVEIVSPSNDTSDYVEKVRDYAAMGIGLYLLVDPRKGTLTVFTDPGGSPDGPRYHGQHDYAFGDDVAVGPWTLSTSGLRPYPAAR